MGGRYTVSASKGGYVGLAYGQRRPTDQGTPLVVGAGERLDKVVLALPRGGVIAGRIVDDAGEPVIDAQVSALRYRPGVSRRPLVDAFGGGGRASTDDQGSFRLFGLVPGEYVVTATVRPEVMLVTGGAESDRDGYAPTYYPGTPSMADAQPWSPLGCCGSVAGS